MITIIVSPASKITMLLYRTLSRCCEVLCITQKEILLPDIAPDILLISSDMPLECEGDVIYVLGGMKNIPSNCTFSSRAVAVVQSHHIAALDFAAQNHLKTLTCGLLHTDTLTLSSLQEESAVLCLQRAVSTFGGGITEPAEIPVTLQSALSRGELLVLASVLLLCGDLDYLSKPL